MNVLRQKWDEQEKHQQLILRCTAAGKKGLEQLVRSTGLPQHFDTLSSLQYLRADYTQQIIRLNDYINSYGKQSEAPLNENEWTQIRNTLYTYLYDHYSKKWAQKLEQLGNKQH